MASPKTQLPQEGTSGTAGGESLPVASAAGCPSYSGGGKDCLSNTNTTTTQARIMELIARDLDSEVTRRPSLDGAELKEVRVRLERVPIAASNAPRQRLPALSDTSDSDMEIEAPENRADRHPGQWGSLGRKRHLAAASGDTEVGPSPKVAGTRKGRGRPPTTGEYVGLAQAKRELAEATRRQLELEAEKDVAELTMGLRSTRAGVRLSETSASEIDDEDELGSVELGGQIELGAAAVAAVCDKSSNLKGTSKKALKEAVAQIRAASKRLMTRNINEETRLLRAANTRLQAEMAALKKEVAELKACMSQAGATPKPATVTCSQSPEEELENRILSRLSDRLNARIDGLEPRLNPEPRLRPALAHDRREAEARPPPASRPRHTPAETQAELPDERRPDPVQSGWIKVGAKGKKKAPTSSSAPAVASSSSAAAQSAHPGQKAKTKKKAAKKKGKAKKPETGRPLPPAPASMKETMASVVKRGLREKAPTTTRSAPTTKKKGQEKVRSSPKLRAPKTSAVVVTLHPTAVEKGVTYAKALAEAKQKVNLKDLEIESVRFKRAATGASIIEIPGATSAPKADLLAERLREVFGNGGDITVSRPTKMSEMIVAGLDDSVTKEEVTAAVAAKGGCAANCIKVGTLRQERSGLFAVWVSCPVEAAKRVVEGKLLVGWVSARVKLLERRELRCFKCLHSGHVKARCTAEVDRGLQCYRCGQLGHRAAECHAAPHCTLCAEAGKAANHLLGSKLCSAPKKRMFRRVFVASSASVQQAQPPPSGEVEMETENTTK
ncbi:axoneme-associated protein mst101(2)-like [Papilio machaon]|uniref:axoneme-associated protein mst101(2)-like n=1 Tax=Papilio machaon TaxID=76193 RepID=UPI001E6638F3|nr:axoneme-associated protein mst101(2)-like [Papilio machaon]XP_045541671.1 axoneme-associated protein mst101(2)-like [Papilio machaon]